MKKILIGSLLCTSFIYANNIYLNEGEKNYIKQLPNPYPVAKRFNQMYNFIKESKDLDLEKMLIKTNYFVNRLLPEQETKLTDNWHNVKEFFIKGKGDCEEYAISKYQILKEIIPDQSKVHLGVVKIKGQPNYHMVTLVEQNNDFLVLDNLSWKVLPILERDDLLFEFGFNENESFVITDEMEKFPIKNRKNEIKKLRQTIFR